MGEKLVVLDYGRKRLYTTRAETSQGASRGDHVRGAMRSPLTVMMAKAELKGKGVGKERTYRLVEEAGRWARAKSIRISKD
jgi:hypothetical protein